MSSNDGSKSFDPFNTNQNNNSEAESSRRGKFKPPPPNPAPLPQEPVNKMDSTTTSSMNGKNSAKPFNPKQTESASWLRQTPLISMLPCSESAPDCVVCFEPIGVYSLFECEHSHQFCAGCVMKIKLFHVHSNKKGADRPLTEAVEVTASARRGRSGPSVSGDQFQDYTDQGDKDALTIDFQKQCSSRYVKCPACYMTQKRIVFTKNLNSTHNDFFPTKPLDMPRVIPTCLADYGVYVDNPELTPIINKMCSVYCNICHSNSKTKNVPQFKTLQELKTHTEAHHSVSFCTACVGACLCYSHELKYMTHSQQVQHYQKGDSATATTTAIKPHPFCRFCKVPYFSNDEQYAHLLSSHLSCKFCHSDNFEFFRTSAALLEHMKNEHYICDICSTGDRADDMVVFTSKLLLNQHLSDVHKNKGMKKIHLNELLNGSYDMPNNSSDARKHMKHASHKLNAAARHHDGSDGVDVVIFMNDYTEVREGRKREQELRVASKQKKSGLTAPALAVPATPSVTPGNATVNAPGFVSDFDKPRDILAENMYAKKHVGRNVVAGMDEQEQQQHALQLSLIDQQPVSYNAKKLNESFAHLENNNFLITPNSAPWGTSTGGGKNKNKNKNQVFTVRAVPGYEKNKSVFIHNSTNSNNTSSTSSSSSVNVPNEWTHTGKKPKAPVSASLDASSPWSTNTASTTTVTPLGSDTLSLSSLREFPSSVPTMTTEKPRCIQALCTLFSELVEERLLREYLQSVYTHYPIDHAELIRSLPGTVIKKGKAAVNKEEVKLLLKNIEKQLTCLSTGERGVVVCLDAIVAVLKCILNPLLSAVQAQTAMLACTKQDGKVIYQYAKEQSDKCVLASKSQAPLMPTESSLVLNHEVVIGTFGAPLPKKKEVPLTGKQAMAQARKLEEEKKALSVSNSNDNTDNTTTTNNNTNNTKDLTIELKKLELTSTPSSNPTSLNNPTSYRTNDITSVDVLPLFQQYLKNAKETMPASAYNAVYYFYVLAQCSSAALRANIKQDDLCTSELLKIVAIDISTIRNVFKQCTGSAPMTSLNMPDIDRLFFSKAALAEIRNLVASFRTGKAVAAKGQSTKISKTIASFENKDLLRLWEYSCIMLKCLCLEKTT